MEHPAWDLRQRRTAVALPILEPRLLANQRQRVLHMPTAQVGSPKWVTASYSLSMDLFEQMTPAERILHVQDLWDRIAKEPESVPISEELGAELDRRVAEHRADPSTAIPWQQVKAELLGRR